MKKLLHYADCLMLLAAICGCGLRYWFGEGGRESSGLFRPSHPAWILLCLLSVGVVVLVWFLTRETGSNHSHQDNFPKSILGAVAYWALAAVMAYTGIMDLLEAGEWLPGLVAVFSMLSAVCLAVAGVERFCGNQPVFFAHMVPCIYFMLRLFLLGKTYGTEPDYCSFLFQFLASVAMVPALYWRWAFDMDMGNRRWSLFFSLLALYFSLVATFESSSGWLMYLLYAMFLLFNLCSLNRLPESAADAVEAEASAEETKEEIPEEGLSEEVLSEEVAEEAVAEEAPVEAVPEEESAPEETVEQEMPAMKKTKPVLHGNIDPEQDMDAFLEDIRLFLDDQGY